MERYDPRQDDARLQDSEPLYLRLLGGFRVSVGDRTIEENEWRLKKAKSLVKLLALAPDHRLQREQVMGLLWPEFDPEAAANNLNHALHVARRVLDPARSSAVSRYLSLEGDWLVLCPDGPLWIDVESFEGAMAMARRNPEDLAAYRAAVERYAGDLLPEDRYEEWAEGRREELRGAYLALLLELAKVHEARGELGAATEALGWVVAEAPEHEGARVGLMRLYAGGGQRHQALRQYEQLKEALWREYEAEPGADSRRLYEEILEGGAPVIRSSAAVPSAVEPSDIRRHNLPATLTSFVGREREIDEIEGLLCTARLLTLTGPGGAGKTRLALEVARDVVEEYPDGAWLVELAPLSEGELAPQAVAAALGVREQPDRPILDTLVDHLRMRQALLVLDNCEHMIDAAARLADALLSDCPNLRILVTSREALRLCGETLWRVPSLSLPDPEGAAPAAVEELRRSEAVRLFVERARYRDPSFELAQHNAAAVGEICRRLEGIPLALELAAARVRVLSAEQMAARLDDSLGLLRGGGRTTAPRQQTLRGALDWSYELLSMPERELLGRLSVFAGGWTLEAAEAVGGEAKTDDVLELLELLVDKSLVTVEVNDDAMRYGMLEPVCQYGWEKLQASAEIEPTRHRHAAWFLALAEEAEPELRGSEQVAWMGRLETEHGNLRAALSWSLGGGAAELGLRLTAVLWPFWFAHGRLSEGRGWLERATSGSATTTTTTAAPAAAKALNGLGWIATHQGEYGAAKASLEKALALHRELENKEGIARSLTYLGLVAALGQRDDISVQALIEEATRLRPELKDPVTIAGLLVSFALLAAGRGDVERALALYEEGLELYREAGDAQGMLTCLTHLGLGAVGQGDHERATTLLRESLRLGRELDYKMNIQYSFFGLAGVATARGSPARAARLWGAAEGIREACGLYLTPLARTHTNYEGYLATARSQLGEEAFGVARAEGRKMPLGGAIEYALEANEPVPQPEQPRVGEPPVALTRREEEVAALIARGLTNRQIATELVVSRRTADTHVGNILRKLGLDSREQVADWWAKQHPLSEDRD